MIDDSDELERELNWTRPTTEAERRRTRPPRGYNAAIGFSMLWFLGLLGLFMKAAGALNGLGATVFGLLACVVLMVVSLKLGFVTWRLIGPAARALIRPIALLGPLPVAAVTLFGVLFLYARLAVATGALPVPAAPAAPAGEPAAAAPEPPPPPPPEKKVQLKLLDQPVPKAGVADACSLISFEWQLATADELRKTGDAIADAHKNLADVKYVWVQRGASLSAHPLHCGGVCSVDLKTFHFGADAWVVCSRPAPAEQAHTEGR